MLLPIINVVFSGMLYILGLIEWLMIGYIILGWLVFFGLIKDPGTVLFRLYFFLAHCLEPILSRIKRFVPSLGPLDLSAIVLFAGLRISQIILLWLYGKIFLCMIPT